MCLEKGKMMKKVCSFMQGVLFGAIVGSTLVLLLTPWSGDQFKENIKDYVNNFQKEVQEAGAERRRELELQLEQLRAGK